MRKLFIIALILLFSASLSACNKAETLTETSSVLPTQETEVIEEPSTQITTSEPTTEKSTIQVVILKEEKEENTSTSTTTLPQITEVKPTQKPKPPENKTTIKNIPESTKPVEIFFLF